MKLRSCFSQNRKLVGVEVVGTGLFCRRCCPMAESQLISVEVFLQFRCGWNFCCWCPVLILLGICWLILSCSLWVVRPTYRQSQRHTYWYHDHTLLCGGQDILMDSRKNLLSRKNDAWIYCSITLINCWFGKPWEPKVDGAFLRSFFLCWIKFRDFLWNAGVDYVFRITIIEQNSTNLIKLLLKFCFRTDF